MKATSLFLALLVATGLKACLALESDVATIGSAGSNPVSPIPRQMEAQKTLLDPEVYVNCKCLDGTPGAYYVNKNPNGNNTWVIYLDGGGECVNAEMCKSKLKTNLGSSTYMANVTWMNRGLLDTNETRNPHFSSANFVRIGYCSQDLWLGSGFEKTEDDLYFQGRYNVHGVLDDLMLYHGLNESDLVIFGGESAGGIGALALMDEVKRSLYVMGSKARVVGSIQGGYYFLNDHTYHGKDPPPAPFIPWGTNHFPGYLNLWGAADALPEECTIHHPTQPWRCIVADYSFPHVTTPVFVAESFTDKTVLPLHNGLPLKNNSNITRDEYDFMKQWSLTMKGSLERNVVHRQSGGSTDSGLFAAACWTHTNFGDGMRLEGLTRAEALNQWIHGRETKLMDPCGTVLCNPTCYNMPDRT